MKWRGKLFGGAFGFLFGGPPGAFVGAILGHRFDQAAKRLEEVWSSPFEWRGQLKAQKSFFNATFLTMGHLAKADGMVTQAEIDWAEQVIAELELGADARKAAIGLFNEGKNLAFALDKMLDRFRDDCGAKAAWIRIFVEIQLRMACADGRLNAAEERVLKQICQRLHFSSFEYRNIKRLVEAQQVFSEWGRKASGFVHNQTSNIDDAYTLLGLKASASDTEIKKAYRTLMNRHHPDKLVSQGVSEESIQRATEKTWKIRKAYELIRENRNFD